LSVREAGSALVASIGAVPAAEWVAVVLAFAYLVLAVRQNPWCWACAIASAAIYLVLFARGGLFMQSALQLFYVGMSVYGWRAWRGGDSTTGAGLPVSRWPAGRHALAIALVLIVTGANGWIIASRVGGWVPYVDAFVAWASVLATWLVARKVLENWVYWIVVDALAAVLYWFQGFHATAVLFLVYVAIAFHGLAAWRADLASSAGAVPGRARA
jgi:nicotinamide mononucleotide transporter